MTSLEKIDKVREELIAIYKVSGEDFDVVFEEINSNPVFEEIRDINRLIIKSYLILSNYRNKYAEEDEEIEDDDDDFPIVGQFDEDVIL